MASTATRSITIVFTGDVVANNTFSAANNAASPAQIQVMQLASGPNTITPPSSGVIATACTIIPPAGNTDTITLKGDAGDVGIVLHDTDPSTIALDSPTTTFVLDASDTINGVRLVWS